MSRSVGLVFALCAILITGCGERPAQKSPPKFDAATQRIAANDAEDWLSYGDDYDEQRYSKLTRINKGTIAELAPAWTYDLSTHRGVEATPVVADGIMYVTSAWSILHAIDAKTGKELWVHDPEVPGESGINACCDVVNRGVTHYDGKIFLGTFDGRLQALDAKTGALIWSTDTITDRSRPYSITGVPRAAKGKVFIGNGGAELGVRGYISAYDAKTGALVWRFFTVPSPDKKPDGAASDEVLAKLGNESWGSEGKWVSDGGGGTVWDSIIYDTVNDSLIFGAGNGSPWNVKARDPGGTGDNLFLSSIVALNPDTGAYKWHFQTTPRDSWDFTATQSLILADLPLGPAGAPRRVVMQAPKNGFFYILDAASGEFISGNNFVPVNWAAGLDKNGRAKVLPAAKATEGAGFVSIPGPNGAHNWHPMAFSPQTGYAYIPAVQMPYLFMDIPEGQTGIDSHWNINYNLALGAVREVNDEFIQMARGGQEGALIAWDAAAQKPAWRVPYDSVSNSGILTTAAGLIFQGNVKGEFFARDAGTGEKLWQSDIKSGLMAAPSTYEIDGEQYIAVAAGWGGAIALTSGYIYDKPFPPSVGRVIVFKLGGTASVPDWQTDPNPQTPKGEKFGDDALRNLGALRYTAACSGCHGGFAISSGVLPDLRWSPVTGDKELWHEIVVEGALKDNGMVGFADLLPGNESEAVRAYILEQAHVKTKGQGKGQ